MIHDEACLAAVARSPNLIVPWVLMASYLYYHRDQNILSDAVYDMLVHRLRDEWATIKHLHKSIIKRASIQGSSSLFDIPERRYPIRCRSAALQLARTHEENAQ